MLRPVDIEGSAVLRQDRRVIIRYRLALFCRERYHLILFQVTQLGLKGFDLVGPLLGGGLGSDSHLSKSVPPQALSTLLIIPIGERISKDWITKKPRSLSDYAAYLV